MKDIFKNHWLIIILNICCLLLAFFALFSVFLPSNVTSHPEYHRWIPKVVTNGNSFEISDFLKSFDVLSFDWIRPRFIDYLFIVFNVKLRLFLYNFFVPFTNLSLHFIITLFIAPILFYKFSKNFLNSSGLAFYSTLLYVTSVGFLSNLVTLFQPAKALAHVAVLMLYLLMSILLKKGNPLYFDKKNYKILFGIFFLNLIGVSIDEGYFVMAVIAPIIFYPLFVPKKLSTGELMGSIFKLFAFFFPFLLFLFFIVKIAPDLVFQASSAKIDFIKWITAKNQEMSKAPFLPFLYKNSISLLASSFSPILFLGEKIPIMLKPVWNAANMAAYIFYCLVLIFVLSYRFIFNKIKLLFQKKSFRYFWKNFDFLKNKTLPIGLAMLFFLVLQSFLMKMHPVVSGAYYYSSLFSIFTAILVAWLFGRGRNLKEDVLGTIIITIVMVVQLVNFYDLNGRWKLFHLQWIHLESTATFPNLLRSETLIKNQNWFDKHGMGSRNLNNVPGLDQNEKGEEKIWKAWKNGQKTDLKNIEGFTEKDALFLHEIDVLTNSKKK